MLPAETHQEAFLCASSLPTLSVPGFVLHDSNEISGSSCTVALQLAHAYQARLPLMHPICMLPVPAHSTSAPGKLGAVCTLPTHGLSQPFGPRNCWFTGHTGTSRSCAHWCCPPRCGAAPATLEVALLLQLTKHQKEEKKR